MLPGSCREWLLMQNEMGMRYFARRAEASGAWGVRGPCHRRLFLECRQKISSAVAASAGRDPGAACQEMCIEDALNRLATRQGLDGQRPKEGAPPASAVCQIDEVESTRRVARTAGAAARDLLGGECGKAACQMARDTGIHGIPGMLMAYCAMCLSRDPSCLEEPYPATGPIEHDAACNDAVLRSGQTAASAGICAAVAPVCKQWDRAVAGPDHGL